MSLINLLLTVLNRGGGEPEKQPWEKGNSWLINTSIKDIIFNVTQIAYRNTQNSENISAGIGDVTFDVKQVFYKDMYTSENISAGITDISFVVTKV